MFVHDAAILSKEQDNNQSTISPDSALFEEISQSSPIDIPESEINVGITQGHKSQQLPQSFHQNFKTTAEQIMHIKQQGKEVSPELRAQLSHMLESLIAQFIVMPLPEGELAKVNNRVDLVLESLSTESPIDLSNSGKIDSDDIKVVTDYSLPIALIWRGHREEAKLNAERFMQDYAFNYSGNEKITDTTEAAFEQFVQSLSILTEQGAIPENISPQEVAPEKSTAVEKWLKEFFHNPKADVNGDGLRNLDDAMWVFTNGFGEKSLQMHPPDNVVSLEQTKQEA